MRDSLSLSILNDPVREISRQLLESLAPFQAAEPLTAGDLPAEVRALEQRIQDAHGVPLRFVLWVGPGALVEMYNSAGLLKAGPRPYILDSNDPEKLKAVVEDMQRISGQALGELLKGTLVVAAVRDAESAEPMVNLKPLDALFERNHLDSAANFAYLQGDLYPLAFAGVDLTPWLTAGQLSDEDVASARELTAFLQAQREAGRDKVSLLLPRSWRGAAHWVQARLDVLIDEKVRLRSFPRVDGDRQDRVFLAVQRKGEAHPEAEQITELRHAKYPVAIVTFASAASLFRLMEFVRALPVAIEESRVEEPVAVRRPAPKDLGLRMKKLAAERAFDRGELVYFGDMRYNEEGRAMRVALERSADRLFRSRLKMPCGIGETPGRARTKTFSIVIAAEKQARFAAAQFEPEFHLSQFQAAGASVAFTVDGAEDFERYALELAAYL